MNHHSNQKRAESFPLHSLEPEGALATPIPDSFGPFAWSGNQFGHKHFSPQLCLGREGFAEPSRMVAGCLQISHSRPLSKSHEAEGNWGWGRKGLGKAGGRAEGAEERDSGCMHGWRALSLRGKSAVWLISLSVDDHKRVRIILGATCWPTPEQWGHV